MATHPPVEALVADDDPLVRAFIRDVLVLQGLAVVEAHNGRRALELLAEHPAVRLVVTDVLMPAVDGVEFIRALRGTAAASSTKVLAISGGGAYGRGLYLETAQALGADKVLAKPFTEDQLVQAVHDLGFATCL